MGRARGSQTGQAPARGVERPLSITAAEVGPFLSGYVLDVSPSLPAGKGLFGRLRALVLHHRRTLALLAMASLLMQLLALVGPGITSVVMNTALPDRARSTLHVVAAGVLLVAAFQACIGWFRDRVLLFLVTRMEVSAERGVLQHLLRLPFPLLDKMTVGERLQAINGVSGARELVAERSLAAVLDGVMAVTFVVAMAAKMPAATLFVVIVATVMAGLSVLAGSAQARHQARRSRRRRASAASSRRSSPASGRSELPGRSSRRSSAGCSASGRNSPCAEAPATRPVERRVPRDVPAGAVRGAAHLGRGADAARRAARRDPPRVRPARQRVSRRGLRARPRPRVPRRPPATARQDAGDPEDRAGEARRPPRGAGCALRPRRHGRRLVPPRPGRSVDREGAHDALRGGLEAGHHRPLRLREEHDHPHAARACTPPRRDRSASAA